LRTSPLSGEDAAQQEIPLMSELESGGAGLPGAEVLASACDGISEPLVLLRLLPSQRFVVDFANAAWLQARGLSRAEAFGRFADELPGSFASKLPLCLEAASAKKPQRYDDAWPRPGGEARVQVTATPLLDASGGCTRVLVVARDWTERSPEETQRSSEDPFRALIERLPDAVMLTGGGRFLYANPAFARLLGYERPEQLLGTTVLDRFHPDERSLMGQRPGAALKSGEPQPAAESRLLARDASTVTVELFDLPVVFGGAPTLMTIARDLRGRKEMEAQLQLADRMISVGTLSAGIAHEINNPLGYVIGNLGYLADGLSKLRGLGQDRAVDVKGLEDALQEVWDGAKRVRNIVHDLKTFSRTDVERREAVDVRRVLEAAIRLAQNELRHTANVEVALPENLPSIEGDASRLSQVFLNVLINAAQAMPDRPSSQNLIRISAAAAEGRVSIEVRDNGSGMTPEVRRRIFDPFFTTKPVGVGTGLGLSIVHSIIKAMRGEVGVESVPGAGTVFHISLPVVVRPIFKGPPPAPVPRDLHARVLVIDDEPLVGTSIRRVLAGEHDVIAVTQGADALRRIAAGERYDALLCDLMMPEMTGMDLHAELTRAVPEQAERMGFLTGGTFTKRASNFVERMGERTLAKPFSTEALRAFVRRLSKH
jgi:PAS domain S-box-containing protein